MGQNFTGFSEESVLFLKNLKNNNNKAWFTEHKPEYLKFLLEPMQKLIVDLGETMFEIDPEFELTPAVDKTISRIYRDTRFSKDKSPYRSAVWISFKRREKEWQDDPAYFFEITESSYRYGMGYFLASIPTMNKLRNVIENRPEYFREILETFYFTDRYIVEGEKYKRIVNPSLPREFQDFYQRKNFYLVKANDHDGILYSDRILIELKENFKLLKRFYDFLRELKN
jgi:uncharacterized protein (TIGR02453 family)